MLNWPRLRYHAEQQRLWRSPARFIVVPAGRRSGKTAIAKRKLARAGLAETEIQDAWFVAAAPTHDQAKRIFWLDLKALIPARFVRRVVEGERTIYLANGASISVLGVDQPARLEGRPIDGIVLDEFGNCKPGVWEANIRPALTTPDRRPGWAWLIGVPEGRNHYFRLYSRALELKAEAIAEGRPPSWDVFTWKSADILPADEIEAARRDLDPLTFAQEYEASFVNFAGRAYYAFERVLHASEPIAGYDRSRALAFCFDFNREPGIAVVVQEIEGRTCAIGEVHIPRNSNTQRVCRRLIADWGPEGRKHAGDVVLYGDATGGAGGSAKVQGSDWDLVKAELRPVFGDRLRTGRVPEANPRERVRVNAMNSRTHANGLRVDPAACPRLVDDLEGVVVLEGGSGEIDKDRDPNLTHLSDALGYYVVREFPVVRASATIEAI